MQQFIILQECCMQGEDVKFIAQKDHDLCLRRCGKCRSDGTDRGSGSSTGS